MTCPPASPRLAATSELVALLDLGSNAARFLLARVNTGVGYRVLEEERVQTRLGAGSPGRLSRPAVKATLRAVNSFLERVSNGSRPRVLAVATEAVRIAATRDRLLTIEGLMLFGGLFTGGYFTLTVCTRGVRDGVLLCATLRGRI